MSNRDSENLESKTSQRYRSLDGLRGVAALIVVFHHSLLAIPTLADPYLDNSIRPEHHGAWLLYTPLHVLWDGPLAVYIFFILSGFVLTVPATRSTISWRSYYPSRLLRLYLPAISAVIVATGLFYVVPRVTRAHASWWINSHDLSLTPDKVLSDASLVRGTFYVNSALWTLQWEVLFSLLLPLYLLAGRRNIRQWPIKIMLLLAVVIIGSRYGWLADGPVYLSMFAVGSVLAFGRSHVEALALALSTKIRGLWPILAVVTLLLITSKWTAIGLGFRTNWELAGTSAAEVAGAFLVVVLAMWWQPFRRSLETRPAQWLGTRSFSLYLIHEPLVVSVAMLLSVRWQPVTGFIAVPLALGAAELFYRLAERPSHRWAKRVGTALRQPTVARAEQIDPAQPA